MIAGFLYIAASAASATAPTPVQSPAATPDVQAQSAQAFVQGFYDWYIGKGGWNWKIVLKNKRWPLGAELGKAVRAELKAPEDPSGNIDSFDFDPFLDAQDTCFPYKSGKATPDGPQYRIEVFASNCEGLQPGKPIVIAVVEAHAGSWDFVNFIYPGDTGRPDTDMLSDLKEFQKERDARLKKGPGQRS